MKRARRGVVSTVVCAAVLIIAACGSGRSSGFAPRNKVSIQGQEINVLLPYKVPERLLAEFGDPTMPSRLTRTLLHGPNCWTSSLPCQ